MFARPPEAADAPGADDVPGQDEPDHPSDTTDGEELVLEVVDVQVPDPIQAHRRHIPHTFPDGVRHVQHVLLVDVPVPRGHRRRQMNAVQTTSTNTTNTTNITTVPVINADVVVAPEPFSEFHISVSIDHHE